MNRQAVANLLHFVKRGGNRARIALGISFAAVTGLGAPVLDFVAPPLGANGPIVGRVLGLETPSSEYMALLLTSQNNKIWWDKTHNVHGIPIAEDGTFKIKGWVVDPHDLQVPYIGIWIVPTNFGKFSAEGTPLPEKIPQAAVASKLINRKDPLWRSLDAKK